MIARKIAERIGRPDLVSILTQELTGSELTSLLLDVLNTRTQQMTPAALLRAYQNNRFVKPADVDLMALRTLEDQLFRLFDSFGYSPVELSPVAPLGSCSVVATADQNKILSATRQTEVVADATNALALHVADLRRTQPGPHSVEPFRFSTIHRHVRTQALPDIPGLRPHFKVACFVTAGRDTGSYQFEQQAIMEHVAMMTTFFRDLLQIDAVTFRLYPRKGYPDPVSLVNRLGDLLRQQASGFTVNLSNDSVGDNNYYKGLQYKIIIPINGQSIEIGDGGFVDWTQQLLQNKKERFLTTGIGLELLYRLLNPEAHL